MGVVGNAFEAGVGFCVQRDKWAALSSEVSRRLRTLAVGGEEYVPIYGGEAVLNEGRVLGRLPSAADGFTGRQNLAYSYRPAELKLGVPVEARVVPPTISPPLTPARTPH